MAESPYTASSCESLLSQEPNAGTIDIENCNSSSVSSNATTVFDEDSSVSWASKRMKEKCHIKVGVGQRNKIRPVDSYQRGYTQLAAVMASDPMFSMSRGFDLLRLRILLDLQDQLVCMEKELEMLDNNDAKHGDQENVLISRRNDELEKTLRQKLLKKIRRTLLKYDEVLLHQQQIQAIRSPTRRAQNSLYRIAYNNCLTVHEEMDWLSRREDLVALARAPQQWLIDSVADTWLAISRKMTLFFFRDPYRRKKSGKLQIDLLSAERFRVFMRIISMILTTMFLLVPTLILRGLQPQHEQEIRYKQHLQLITVLASVFIFCASSAIFTQDKKHSLFIYTCAYYVVLLLSQATLNSTMATSVRLCPC